MAEMTIQEALTRLNVDIDRVRDRLRDTQATLAELELKRQGAEALLGYMGVVSESRVAAPSKSTLDTSPASVVEAAMKDALGAQSVDQVVDALHRGGHDLAREQVRNALHYLSRKGVIENAGRRGWWRLTDTSAPVVAGAEVSDRSNQEGRSWEDGDTSGAVAPGDLGTHQAGRPAYRGHRDGAPIEGVTV